MMQKNFFVGIDAGSSRTKAVVLNSAGQLIGRAVRKSGTDFGAAAEECLAEALAAANLSRQDISCIVSTGYGRQNIPSADLTKTEISCQGRGCFYSFPKEITIIDIGGQDNKIIKLDSKGRRVGFKMNRKCAAGTGAFLEEMALRLDIPLEEMDGLAGKAGEAVELGSYCTVFTATEVLEKIRQGKKVPDIVKGLFLSVIRRVIEMDLPSESIVMTGGVVAHNPQLVVMAEGIMGRALLIPEHPQLTGAIGAALYAAELKAARSPAPDGNGDP